MNSSTSAVTLDKVCHDYDNTPVLSNIDLELPAGNTLALLGHNGAGKSTLIKIILGLIAPASGKVSVLGDEVSYGCQSASVGYLPENISFYDKMTGAEVLNYFAALKGVNPNKVGQTIEEFGLGYAQHKAIKGYSKGMKQRLGFAQAILAAPRLLLLDEPTVGLDPQASQFLYSKVAGLTKRGCSVIICTHELNLVESHLDVAMMMGRGRCLAYGDLPSLMKQENLAVTFQSPSLAGVISQHPQLNEFYHDGMLRCRMDQKEWLVQYLTHQCQVFDFIIKQPSLDDIYHKKMSQMQSHDAHGLSFVAQHNSQALGVL